MAEIFVVNKSAALDGALVSDLPVTNAAPVARQIQFYIASLHTDYATELADYLTAVGANVGNQVTAAGMATFIGTQVAANAAIDVASLQAADGASGMDYGTGSVEDALRILVGADSSDGAIEETGNLGNHRILGGSTRRLYTRDRVDASIHEGFLRAQLDAGSIIIYNIDGSVAHS